MGIPCAPIRFRQSGVFHQTHRTVALRKAIIVRVQERAQTYCASIKASPDSWRLCAERFTTTAYVEVKFWCLQALHEVPLGTKGTHCPGLLRSAMSVMLLLVQ